MPSTAEDLASRCAPIELVVIDVDGVLTDGTIVIDDHGVESKHFYVRDGSAISLWRKAGKRVAILSGRQAACVDVRAAELGISPVIQGAAHKAKPFRSLVGELGFETGQTCYIGDDLADLPALAIAGLAACPADAAPEVRCVAHFVSTYPGGRGAVRDIVEFILKSQNAWNRLVDAMSRE